MTKFTSQFTALGLIVLSTAILSPKAEANPTTALLEQESAAALGGPVLVECQQAFELGVLPEHCGVGLGNEPVFISPEALQTAEQEILDFYNSNIRYNPNNRVQFIFQFQI